MKLGHVALTAKDPKALARFYEGLLGVHTVGEAVTSETGPMVFLSTDPHGPPQLQLMANPEAWHVAFQVDTLAELRDLYADALRRGTVVTMALDHGPTFSFYVRDPDGNACEVYWATGRRAGGPNRPIDLSKSEAELLDLIRS